MEDDTIEKLKNSVFPFEYKAFNSSEDINNYLSHEKYMLDEDHPGLCFGFSVVRN